MTEGTIEEWKKKEGDAVKVGDVLLSVATDKLTNDVECDTDGTLLKILFGEGETVACKTVIAWIGSAGEAVPGASAASAPAAASAAPAVTAAPVAAPAATAAANRATGGFVLATPYARKLAKDKGYDLSQIPGTGPNGTVVAKDVESFVAGPKTSPMGNDEQARRRSLRNGGWERENRSGPFAAGAAKAGAVSGGTVGQGHGGALAPDERRTDRPPPSFP